MSLIPKVFLQNDELTLGQNVVYRNFNILLAVALIDVTFIIFQLLKLEQTWPMWIILPEYVLLISFLILHIRGYLLIARYGTFFVILTAQSMACIIHGKANGFDYVFYAIAVLPALFFEKPRHYLPLFAVSVATLLGIHHVYTVTQPLLTIPGDFIFYWNLFSTAAVILLVMYTFKSGYERAQKRLIDQRDVIAHQKEEIEGINNNLEQIIIDRTEKIKDQESRISHFAFINAHKVRSPLARIMGLLHVIDLDKNKDHAFQECLPKLRSNAEELNVMLREVSHTLNEIKNEGNNL
jgi:signal transduction histidine kinase